MRAHALALAFVLSFLSRIASAQENRVPFLAVFEFQVENKAISLDTAVTLAKLVRSRMVGSCGGVVRLISPEKVVEILSRANKSAAQCKSECEIQTAREIGADYVMTGSVSSLGSQTVVVLDVKKALDGVTVASMNVRTSPDHLADKLDMTVDQLAAMLRDKLRSAAPIRVPEVRKAEPPVGTIVPKSGGALAATWRMPEMRSYLEIDDLRTAVVDKLFKVPSELRMIVYKNGEPLSIAHRGQATYRPIVAKLPGSKVAQFNGLNPFETNDVFVAYRPGDKIELIFLVTIDNVSTASGVQELWTPALRLMFDRVREPGENKTDALLGMQVFN